GSEKKTHTSATDAAANIWSSTSGALASTIRILVTSAETVRSKSLASPGRYTSTARKLDPGWATAPAKVDSPCPTPMSTISGQIGRASCRESERVGLGREAA